MGENTDRSVLVKITIIPVVRKAYTVRPSANQQKNHFYLYDADLLASVDAQMFDPAFHRKQETIQGEALGRGTTYMVKIQEHSCVLRHYQRGGLVAKLLKDQYLWTGVEQTRAWREWHLLKQMAENGLPVPQPVAAHVVKGALYYRADLMTMRLRDSKSLTEYLRKNDLPQEQWRNIGRTIRAFHNAGIYHADLNAHNVMLNTNGEVFLIDFDKGEQRTPNASWQRANIDRFQRSLEKLSSQVSPFYFSQLVWQQFNKGYNQ